MNSRKRLVQLEHFHCSVKSPLRAKISRLNSNRPKIQLTQFDCNDFCSDFVNFGGLKSIEMYYF